jgi:hypothetical protein
MCLDGTDATPHCIVTVAVCYPSRMRLRPILLCALTACAGNTATQAAVEHPEAVTKAADAKADDPRRFSDHPTFGELVRLAQTLDNATAGHSSAGCLIELASTDSSKAHLNADLSPAARPLPDASVQCDDAVVEQVGPVAVMSTWGNIPGETDAGLLVAFTTTSPAAVKAPAIGMFVTQRGVLLRGADASLRAHPELMTQDQAGALLGAVSGSATVYATADRELELRALVAALELVPNRFEIALAVTLPKGTHLPASAPSSHEAMCPNGLPAPAMAEHEGELDSAAAQRALAPLREAALSCALNAGGRALLGGHLVLALRIGANGRALETCFSADEIAEPALRRCLIAAARDLPYPQPSAAGFADLEIPLQIALEGPSAQRVRCQ